MDGYSISQAAERTGFTPSALRFYERAGLVRPGRTPAGYRRYTEEDVGALRFIARGKRLGLALDQVAELVPLFRGQRCAPVQDRLRALVDRKIGEAQGRVGELYGLTSELRRAAGSLHEHTPDGPCDDACGCTGEAVAVGPPIVCTLSEEERRGRGAEWRAALAAATAREETPAGVRLRFQRSVAVGALADLAAAENDCCRWAAFTITIGHDDVTMEVTGAAAAREAIVRMYRPPG
ncbi:MAG TPA: MerR family transcriptional regulator [Terriglobales bacterium]|nr:MerR family transcriptional regulator [Terriglobales bacterium]